MTASRPTRSRSWLALAALAVTTSCGGGGGGGPVDDGKPRVPVTHAISINDGFYYPKEITIVRGDSVLWSWAVTDVHSVTSGTTPDPSEDPRLFDSGVRNSGSFGHRFGQAGTFSFFCRKHWDMGMTGTVTVESP